ncbi:glycosyltransferase family 4 protein [uncultured Serinicoccus sp.]|uniref:glycosyltransferase family 4 protein n=1 Tax=uncultured Serinicoccus sp. TaxID=735514 RepID=UPI002633E98A|nr:glycosyltransferase family 4 protein [uncultured Serinicoccus sp.]
MSDRPHDAAGVTSTGRDRQRIAAVALDAGDLDAAADRLRTLTDQGHQVVLLWCRGEPGPGLRSFRARVPVRARPPRTPRELAGRLRRPGPAAWWRDGGPLARALRADPRARRTLGGVNALVPVGPQAHRLFDRAGAAPAPLLRLEDLDDRAGEAAVWTTLHRRSRAGGARLDADLAREVLAQLPPGGSRIPPRRQALLVPLVVALHGTGEYALAARLAERLDDDPAHGPDAAVHRALRTLVELSRTGEAPADLDDTVRSVLARADDALGEGVDDVSEEVVRATTLALQLLFHRELHADGLDSPLVTDPETFLAGWRASRVGQLVAAPVPRLPPHPRTGAVHPSGDGSRGPRVVVAPGSYPQFATPVVEELTRRADVRVLDLRAKEQLRGLGTRGELVAARLRQAAGQAWVPDYELLEELEAADALFVDWADRGSVAAVMSTPTGVRVTLRIHSMDALSPWIHLLDWTRVDALVLVSEHLRRVVEALLGDRLAGTQVRVVGNVLDPARIPTGKAPGHRRTLLMVGWAQRVKDPLWALEVLALLRREDPSWRLVLVGVDFPESTVASQQDYARAFRRRLADDDVRGAVSFVGWTRDLAPHLEAAGFVLSTSRRESFGLALVEGAASGAVPVVRDWPIFAPLDGARSLFPDDWVVGSVEEAAARVVALAEDPAWSDASAQARAVVQERFAAGVTRTELAGVILGE